MAPPRKIYDMFIEPIRTMDRREGQGFLERWLRGPQEVWSRIDAIILSIPTLWSVTDCPSQFLQYLKWIVGWTSELDGITRELDDDELRRLISVSGRLWKERGSDDALIDTLFFATGARSRYWDWFDFRWLLPYVGPTGTVTWIGSYWFNVNPAVGDARRDGTLVRVTCLPTGVYVEQPCEWAWDTNQIHVFGLMGQGGPPSTDPNDFELRLVNPLGTELGEEHEGRDPWIVDLPDPTVAGAEYESNLRIVDDGTLNRALVVNLVKLMRATGERWEITYLGLLDRFLIDDDDTQWDTQDASFLTIAGGTMLLGDASDTADNVECILPAAVWSQAMYYARFRTSAPVPATSAVAMSFHFQDDSNTYALIITTNDSDNGPAVWLLRQKGGSGTFPVMVDMTAYFPLYPDVYYSYRVVVTDEGSSKRIRVSVDNVEIIDYLDTDPIANGTVGFATNFTAIEVDEVEVMSLPAESDYVDINS